MKRHTKLIFLSALPLLFLLIAACGPYGAPAFDSEQALGIVAGTTTFSVAEKTIPLAKTQKRTVADPNLSFGSEKVYVETLEFTDLDMTLISSQDKADPVVERIELGSKFTGWGPGFLTIGYSQMDAVEASMGKPKFKNKRSLFYDGIEFRFANKINSKKPVLSKVVIG